MDALAFSSAAPGRTSDDVARQVSHYSLLAVLLHWAIALLILANIGVGLVFESLGRGLAAFRLIQLHKSLGLTVLALTALRLGWRLANPPPPLILPLWQKRVSGLVHLSLYALMFALPLTGWIMVSASPLNLPTLYFGVLAVPHIAPVHALAAPARKAVGDAADGAHIALVWAACALIALHVAAALKHQVFDRDDVLARMLPARGRRAPRGAHAA